MSERGREPGCRVTGAGWAGPGRAALRASPPRAPREGFNPGVGSRGAAPESPVRGAAVTASGTAGGEEEKGRGAAGRGRFPPSRAESLRRCCCATAADEMEASVGALRSPMLFSSACEREAVTVM